MSGGRDAGSSRHTFLGRFIDSFRRPAPPARQEQRPIEEDLGLKTLRNVYSQYVHTEDPADKERRLYTMLPLFLKNCSRLKGSELVTRFPECLEFSEHVALLFVRHVTQKAQMHGAKAGEVLLKFLDLQSSEEQTGALMLKVLQVYIESSQHVLSMCTNIHTYCSTLLMYCVRHLASVLTLYTWRVCILVHCTRFPWMPAFAHITHTLTLSLTLSLSSDLSSILVRCVHLFLDLPLPTPLTPALRDRSTSGITVYIYIYIYIYIYTPHSNLSSLYSHSAQTFTHLAILLLCSINVPLKKRENLSQISISLMWFESATMICIFLVEAVHTYICTCLAS